ncbi:S8 family serine peptidase [Acetobacterium woodii]|uniref:Putative serine proteinase n=1 Tax=Acetobacterium woodii (strain ATCC 29683 / DSM 1030 / JCM 2381 / KCTC 1655 / WB1) TaxID=931626 RepID=H6LE81_ACEWD|nr:S8 family serine peptidase [Acetobacterium woodii]AFA49314.1 putative serine proteinase [Acetobacterium woodii DSM 1030]
MKFKMKRYLFLFCIVLFIIFFPANISAQESLSINGPEPTVKESDSQPMIINSLSELPDVDKSDDLNRQIVVIYKNSTAFNVQSLFLSTSEIASGETVSDRVDVFELKNDVDVDSFIAKMNENPNVLIADHNSTIKTYALPNDPYVTDGKAWQFQKIGTNKTWDQVKNATTIGVAVLDSGVNTNHPDLIGRTIAGYDYVTKSTQVVDEDGHGTAVSGCIAATANNGIGISGIAGSANIMIAPYRVGSKSLYTAYICAALIDAADRSDIKIINMSYGGYTYDPLEATAINYAKDHGKILVAASGNEGDPSDLEAGLLSYPASYDGVISVAATTSSNQRASFSQYNNMVDLAAPGEGIYTTSNSGSYLFMNGTSFSAPIVAGACGVLLAANENLSASEVENILERTATDLGTVGRDDYFGFGLIQLDQALATISASKHLTAISLNKSATTITNGNWDILNVSYLPVDTTDDKNIIWTSSNPAVATVNGDGFVNAINAGNCTITAQVGNFYATCRVTVPHQTGEISIGYQTHIENIGWQNLVYDGDLSGTSGQGYRLEGLKIVLDKQNYDVGVAYKTHIQNIGWEDNWRNDGALSGTSGEGLRLEAVCIKLTGNDANQFDLYYRTHVQNLGWLGWAKAGDDSGTSGYGYRLEGIEIMVVPKNTPFDSSGNAFIVNPV